MRTLLIGLIVLAACVAQATPRSYVIGGTDHFGCAGLNDDQTRLSFGRGLTTSLCQDYATQELVGGLTRDNGDLVCKLTGPGLEAIQICCLAGVVFSDCHTYACDGNFACTLLP